MRKLLWTKTTRCWLEKYDVPLRLKGGSSLKFIFRKVGLSRVHSSITCPVTTFRRLLLFQIQRNLLLLATIHEQPEIEETKRSEAAERNQSQV